MLTDDAALAKAAVRARGRFPFERARWIRAALAATAIILPLAAVLAYAGISLRVAEALTHVDRRSPVTPPSAVADAHEPVAFVTSDGIRLRGWTYSAPNARGAVVLVHGRNGNRIDGENGTVQLARSLLAAGYSVLLFDLRGHGESEGDRFSLGQHEAKDVAAAIDHLVERGERIERIGIIGNSMGAAGAIEALTLRPAVGAVVADSSFMTARQLLDEIAPRFTGLPEWFTPGVVLAAKVVFGIDADAVRPVDVVRRHATRSFLFIHCDQDELIGVHHAHALRTASAHSGTTLELFTGCAHTRAFVTAPERYEQLVLGFLGAQLRW